MSEDRMRKLELDVASFTASVKEFIKASEKRDRRQDELNKKLFDLIRETTTTIHGEKGEPGIKGRVDRLETKGKFAAWFAGTALGGVMLHTIKILMEK